jgi:Flp pilus assembly protein TadG
MSSGYPGQAAVGYLRAVLGTRFARLAEARRSGDRGASAIELAIITAVLVGLAVVVLLIINTVVRQRAQDISNQNGKIP